MFSDFIDRTQAKAIVAVEDSPAVARFTRRSLGLLAGAAAFAGLTKSVEACNGCSPRCDDVCPGYTDPCNACGGVQCWEGNGAYTCCDYHCPAYGGQCCSAS